MGEQQTSDTSWSGWEIAVGLLVLLMIFLASVLAPQNNSYTDFEKQVTTGCPELGKCYVVNLYDPPPETNRTISVFAYEPGRECDPEAITDVVSHLVDENSDSKLIMLSERIDQKNCTNPCYQPGHVGTWGRGEGEPLPNPHYCILDHDEQGELIVVGHSDSVQTKDGDGDKAINHRSDSTNNKEAVNDGDCSNRVPRKPTKTRPRSGTRLFIIQIVRQETGLPRIP